LRKRAGVQAPKKPRSAVSPYPYRYLNERDSAIVIAEHIEWLESGGACPRPDVTRGYPLAQFAAQHVRELARIRTAVSGWWLNTKCGSRCGK
jgi:hypothetical protein